MLHMGLSSEWMKYFEVIALVSGAVLVLLFVGLQVGFDRWHEPQLRSLRSYVAATVLLELVAPLGISLFALLPGQRWWIASFIAAGLGAIGIVGHSELYRRDKKRDKGRAQQRQQTLLQGFDRFQVWASAIISTIAYGLLLFGALYRNYPVWLPIVGYVCIWLIVSGLFESWVLVTFPKGGLTSDVAGDSTEPRSIPSEGQPRGDTILKVELVEPRRQIGPSVSRSNAATPISSRLLDTVATTIVVSAAVAIALEPARRYLARVDRTGLR
ncbi:hypothetical protein A5780_08745 [Nocardia sp. 852002-20019_SCH5090214]|uniref:hypothetical protein n=1 Tax=Nocardia sp. 852002-20019_SCH5090214 TaxID=1834087 RepID=UPI0007EA838D|nr:hypothetical protein [Nocardia sp. 852002-20019_SCH5090214]OBA68228.1 hypothetical protein A5780_08745 [Nocardia sp. 852002-20019_SCH5090214]